MKAVAFKVTYNDGGAGAGLLGFRGVCSNRNILENVRVRKMTNCSDKNHCCRKFADRNFTGRRPSINQTLCYEAQLFNSKRLRFGGGYYHNGERKGEPIPMKGVEPGDIALLTTLLPGGTQQDRIVFGCFRVKSVNLKKGWGYMAESDGTMDIVLPDNIARQMNFWQYFQNSDGSRLWGTGLFRYLEQDNSDKLLADLLWQLGDNAQRDILLKALPEKYRLPVNRIPSVDSKIPGGGGYGGGESEAHLNLKNFVAKNPEKIGLPRGAVAKIEFPYLSGDRVDIKFDIDKSKGKAAVVEIETIDTLPGAHQCVKYRALLEASLGHSIGSGFVEAILVAHRFDDATRAFANSYGIRLVEMIV